MKKQYDVVAMGEMLIDFTMNGQSAQGNFEICKCSGSSDHYEKRSDPLYA